MSKCPCAFDNPVRPRALRLGLAQGDFNLAWTSNSKVSKTHAVSLSLPQMVTCLGSCVVAKRAVLPFRYVVNPCAACYAKGHEYRKQTKRLRDFNLRMTKERDFVGLAIDDIRRMTEIGVEVRFASAKPSFTGAVKAIRWHDSGDFYSQKYLDDVAAVMMYFTKERPRLRFYAYSKSLNLRFPKLENFLLVKSVGGRYDHKIDFRRDHHAVVFCKDSERKAAGYADGWSGIDLPSLPKKDVPRKIGLVLHGLKGRGGMMSDGSVCELK